MADRHVGRPGCCHSAGDRPKSLVPRRCRREAAPSSRPNGTDSVARWARSRRQTPPRKRRRLGSYGLQIEAFDSSRTLQSIHRASRLALESPKRYTDGMLRALTLLAAMPLLASAQNIFPPFRIIGNVYYVGESDLTSYLIVTPKGGILINTGFDFSVPEIRSRVRTLGFKFSDIKIL